MNKVLPMRSVVRWPLPALVAWGLAWGTYAGLRASGEAAAAAAGALIGLGIAAAWPESRWRRALVASGFPLSWLALWASAGVPPVAWLVALGAVLAIYPLGAWRDAPWYPTPRNALQGLQQACGLRAGARVLDAGCGLGDGLLALRAALPSAHVEGIERSLALTVLARLRCRFARVGIGDMWRADWHGYDLVYLFQRPESMARAMSKAEAELSPGAWLASLEFAVPGRAAQATLNAAGRVVWLYRMHAQPEPAPADIGTTAHAGDGRR